jgi:hypothetical protein
MQIARVHVVLSSSSNLAWSEFVSTGSPQLAAGTSFRIRNCGGLVHMCTQKMSLFCDLLDDGQSGT